MAENTTRVALITGGSRGIGLGIAQALAREGLTIVICGVREESAVSEAIESIRAAGAADVMYCQADVSDSAARDAMLRAIDERFGNIDVLVNNAGVAPNVRADILEASEESFERLIHINLQGPYFLTQAVARGMVERQQAEPSTPPPCIINVGSISATVASPSRGDYCITKAGIAMMSQLWSVRLGEYGIPVYEIRPGVIKTDMTSAVTEKYDKLIAEGLCVEPRWGTPEDVGKAAAALARGDFPYATGQVVMIDGGLTLLRL